MGSKAHVLPLRGEPQVVLKERTGVGPDINSVGGRTKSRAQDALEPGLFACFTELPLGALGRPIGRARGAAPENRAVEKPGRSFQRCVSEHS